MSILQDGKAVCDRCGDDIGNAAIDKAVAINGLADDGSVVTLHLGLVCSQRCATRVLTTKALAARQSTAPVSFYNPNGGSNGK